MKNYFALLVLLTLSTSLIALEGPKEEAIASHDEIKVTKKGRPRSKAVIEDDFNRIIYWGGKTYSVAKNKTPYLQNVNGKNIANELSADNTPNTEFLALVNAANKIAQKVKTHPSRTISKLVTLRDETGERTSIVKRILPIILEQENEKGSDC